MPALGMFHKMRDSRQQVRAQVSRRKLGLADVQNLSTSKMQNANQQKLCPTWRRLRLILPERSAHVCVRARAYVFETRVCASHQLPSSHLSPVSCRAVSTNVLS